ncbi:hypothetical protein Barb6_01724 [Bacteroidales bacterium Barb6]|nr:hypothetical protein Barb6_01724 [Bacteroidales bacterium Barb6]
MMFGLILKRLLYVFLLFPIHFYCKVVYSHLNFLIKSTHLCIVQQMHLILYASLAQMLRNNRTLYLRPWSFFACSVFPAEGEVNGFRVFPAFEG